MLPSSQTPNPPAPAKLIAARRFMVPVLAILMGYTMFIGWGLLFGWVRADTAYLLIALPCIVPIAWYAYGFLNVKEPRQDFGLLLSAVGWALVALALLIKHSAVANAAAATGDAVARADNPAGATICALLAALFLVIGALLSWQAWQREIQTGQGIQD